MSTPTLQQSISIIHMPLRMTLKLPPVDHTNILTKWRVSAVNLNFDERTARFVCFAVVCCTFHETETIVDNVSAVSYKIMGRLIEPMRMCNKPTISALRQYQVVYQRNGKTHI